MVYPISTLFTYFYYVCVFFDNGKPDSNHPIPDNNCLSITIVVDTRA